MTMMRCALLPHSFHSALTDNMTWSIPREFYGIAILLYFFLCSPLTHSSHFWLDLIIQYLNEVTVHLVWPCLWYTATLTGHVWVSTNLLASTLSLQSVWQPWHFTLIKTSSLTALGVEKERMCVASHHHRLYVIYSEGILLFHWQLCSSVISV